jgi:hypothetical protein
MAKSFYAELAEKRRLVTLPADAADAAKLAPRYASDDLGEISGRICSLMALRVSRGVVRLIVRNCLLLRVDWHSCHAKFKRRDRR